MNLLLATILGFLFIAVFGTLGHFAYEWSHHNKWAAVFFAVNESTWEHIKIALTPFFVWTIIEIPSLINNPNFIFAKTVSLLILIVGIPLLFYGYRSLVKKGSLVVDITIFYITIFIAQYVFYYIMNRVYISDVVTYISFIAFVVIFIGYLLFTLLPLDNELFIDPISNKKGIKGHTDIIKKK